MGLFSYKVPENVKEQPKPAAFNAPRAITASAAQINLKKKDEVDVLRRRLEASKRWQQDAFDYTELIGELDFAANMVANTISKIRLFPGYITSEDTAPSYIWDMPEDQVSDDLKKAALETLRLLSTGDGGISGVLRDAALNLFITGECYLIQEPAPGDSFFASKPSWQIRSVDELVVKETTRGGNKIYLKGSRHDKDEDLVPLGAQSGPNKIYMGRIWRNSPRYSKEATSSLKPQLENCDMLLMYDRSKRGIVKSRMNAGILYIPDGLSASADADGEMIEDPESLEDEEMAPAVEEMDSLEDDLMDGLTLPIQDEGAVSSVVPIFLRGPAELGAAIRHITFSRPFDPQITTDAEKLLQRILIGIDLPKEVVAGLTDAKYANAIVVEDNFYKMHIEPMILMIVDAFTSLLMRTVLSTYRDDVTGELSFTEDEISRVVIWYDPSPVSTKPDKATAATTGLENGAVSYEAWRRSNGFSESDAPSGLERIQRFALKQGLLSEPVTEAALHTIYPELFDRVRAQATEATDSATQQAVDEALGTGTAPSNLAEPDSVDDTNTEEEAPPVPLVEP